MMAVSPIRLALLAVGAVLGLLLTAFAAQFALAPTAQAQTDPNLPSVIVNEWNAVSNDSILLEGDSRLGVIAGNGGDWFELVVVQDHVDMRNWSVSIEVSTSQGPNRETLRFTDHPLWSDIRAGTIITVTEETITASNGVNYGEDVSYNPAAGDWWINVVANETGSGLYIEASRFPVTSNDWQATVNRADDSVDFGPIGEGIGTLIDGGISADEIGELEQDPSAQLDPATALYDDGNGSTFGSANSFDSRLQNFGPLRAVGSSTEVDCGSVVATVNLALGQVPTNGNDVIVGTPGPDVIAAGDGDDVICGLGGNDIIFGQNGNDIIHGGEGDDKLRGGNGNDTIHGDNGADNVAGGRDDDFVYGDAGDDPIVRGNTGDDLVDGGPGNDALVAGNGGSDTVIGGPGDDKVTGGPRPDTVSGGSGQDEVKGNKGADIITGDDGNDILKGGPQPDTIDGGGGTDDCNGGTTGDDAVEGDSAVNCEVIKQVP